MPAIDPNALPKDVESLRKIVVDLCEQLQHESSEKDKLRSLLRELLEAQRTRKSEQLSKEQQALFESLWKVSGPEDEESEPAAEEHEDKPDQEQTNKRSGRQPLAKNVVRERIVHDLAEAEKHCSCCGKDLRLIAEETSTGSSRSRKTSSPRHRKPPGPAYRGWSPRSGRAEQERASCAGCKDS